MKLRKGLALMLALGMLTGLIGCNKKAEELGTVTLEADVVKNVILFIGDGMGPEQIKFGEIMKEAPLCFQEFPYMTQLNTDSVDGLTDSAAAATALAWRWSSTRRSTLLCGCRQRPTGAARATGSTSRSSSPRTMTSSSCRATRPTSGSASSTPPAPPGSTASASKRCPGSAVASHLHVGY